LSKKEKMMKRLLILTMAASVIGIGAADATTRSHHHKYHRHHTSHHKVRHARRHIERTDVRFIPNPPGTWRVSQSCAHRAAAALHLVFEGKDKVSTWAHVFPRTSLHDGVVAIRNDLHHLMIVARVTAEGILVRDYNSGGHLNREYWTTGLPGYFFVEPSARVAARHSRTIEVSAHRRHGRARANLDANGNVAKVKIDLAAIPAYPL
jgi:hypothetical protein